MQRSRLTAVSLVVLGTAAPAAAHEFLHFEHLQGGTIRSITMLSRDLAFSAEDGGRIRRWDRDTTTGAWTGTFADTDYDSRYLLRDVSFGDALNGWAVGYGGRVLRTTDGGGTWSLASSTFLTEPGSSELADLYAVRFVLDSTIGDWRGWVTGFDGTLYTSTDAGTSWTPLAVPSGSTDLYGLAVQPNGAGLYKVWVCGDQGTVLYSTDNGASWSVYQQLASSASCAAAHPNLELWDVDMPIGGIGRIAGGNGNGCGAVFFTTNGTTWTQETCFDAAGMAAPYDHFLTLYGLAQGAAGGPLTVGYGSQVNVLRAASSCWEQETDLSLSYLGQPPLFAAAEHPGTRQMLVGGLFNVMRASNDSGLTWSNQAGLHVLRERDAACVTDEIGCVVGQGHRILRSTDGMHTFTQVHVGTNPGPSFQGIAFSPVNTSDWMAVGDDDGFAYAAISTNQGASWTRLPSTSFVAGTHGLRELAFHPTAAQTALVVGNAGRVYRTTNLGTSFAAWNSGVPAGTTPSSVVYTPGGDAFVVGTPSGGNSAWRSAGGANAWSAVPLKDALGATITNATLNAAAAGGSLVWAVGDGGLVFAYDAGTNTFQQQVPTQPAYDPTEDLVGIAIHPTAATTHVVIGGRQAGVLYTNGTIWTLPRSRLSDTGEENAELRLSAIAVFDSPSDVDGIRGYVFGRQFAAARFASSGSSW